MSVRNISLVEMKKAGLEGCELKTLLQNIPGLIVWAKNCLIHAHKFNRAEYLLSVLNKKNMELQVVLENTEKHIDTRKCLISESHSVMKGVLQTLEINYDLQKKQLQEEIGEIKMAMKSVGELIVVNNIGEPSVNN